MVRLRAILRLPLASKTAAALKIEMFAFGLYTFRIWAGFRTLFLLAGLPFQTPFNYNIPLET